MTAPQSASLPSPEAVNLKIYEEKMAVFTREVGEKDLTIAELQAVVAKAVYSAALFRSEKESETTSLTHQITALTRQIQSMEITIATNISHPTVPADVPALVKRVTDILSTHPILEGSTVLNKAVELANNRYELPGHSQYVQHMRQLTQDNSRLVHEQQVSLAGQVLGDQRLLHARKEYHELQLQYTLLHHAHTTWLQERARDVDLLSTCGVHGEPSGNLPRSNLAVLKMAISPPPPMTGRYEDFTELQILQERDAAVAARVGLEDLVLQLTAQLESSKTECARLHYDFSERSNSLTGVQRASDELRRLLAQHRFPSGEGSGEGSRATQAHASREISATHTPDIRNFIPRNYFDGESALLAAIQGVLFPCLSEVPILGWKDVVASLSEALRLCDNAYTSLLAEYAARVWGLQQANSSIDVLVGALEQTRAG